MAGVSFLKEKLFISVMCNYLLILCSFIITNILFCLMIYYLNDDDDKDSDKCGQLGAMCARYTDIKLSRLC